MPNFYAFTPEKDILKCIVQHVQSLKKNPLDLPSFLIFMPTRRACRLLEMTFLGFSQQKTAILPTIIPLGDPPLDLLPIHKQEKVLQGLLPPDENTQLLEETLAINLIEKLPFFDAQPWKVCHMEAIKLLSFYEKMMTQGSDLQTLDWESLRSSNEFGNNKLDFFSIFFKTWPNILKENNILDRGTYRYRLISELTSLWNEVPPTREVLAVVTAGWIPPTLSLLKTLRNSPKTQVWFYGAPGNDITTTKLRFLPETHPFTLFRDLLNEIGTPKLYVPDDTQCHRLSNVNFVTKGLLYPYDAEKRDLKLASEKTNLSLESTYFHVLESVKEEAQFIAFLLRETLNHKGKTAALITPDRKLASQVQAHLTRWGLNIDDSAGKKLTSIPFVITCMQILKIMLNKFEHRVFSSLFKSKFLYETWRITENQMKNLYDDLLKKGSSYALISSHLYNLLSKDKKSLERYEAFQKNINKKVVDTCKSHVEMASQILEIFIDQRHWQREDATVFLRVLNRLRGVNKKLEWSSFLTLFTSCLEQEIFRTPQGDHPRLSILGLREARLTRVDRAILGGLNENTWPSPPQSNMWSYFQLQEQMKLPSEESKICHDGFDFYTNLCAHDEVYITRSLSGSSGPTTPSRWLEYMNLYGKLSDIPLKSNDDMKNKFTAFQKSTSLKTFPLKKPPKLNINLKQFIPEISVTQVEQFFNNPYILYIHKVLKLRPLEQLNNKNSALDFGVLTHSIMELFTHFLMKNRTDNNEEFYRKIFMSIAKKMLTDLAHHSIDNPFWVKRLERLALWAVPQFLAVKQEEANHSLLQSMQAEKWVRMEKQGLYTLVGKIDRLDSFQCQNSGVPYWRINIVDYKTGSPPSKKSVIEGSSLQLPLEAIAAKNTLELQAKQEKNPIDVRINSLSYWFLHHQAPQIIEFSKNETNQAIQSSKLKLLVLDKAWSSSSFAVEATSVFDDIYTALVRSQEWEEFHIDA